MAHDGVMPHQATPELLPGELLVAIFYRLGDLGFKKFNQDKLVDSFGRAAKEWDGIWRAFGQKRSGASLLDNEVAQLLHGGSLVIESMTNTIRPTPHTLGPYGQGLYDNLPTEESRRIGELVSWIIEAGAATN